MSIFAGVVSHGGAPIPDGVAESIRRALSRDPAHDSAEYRTPNAYLATIDIQAFGSPGLAQRDGGTVAMLAGHPLLRGGTGSRSDHLAVLHDAWDHGDWGQLHQARGTFCAAHYDPGRHALSLIADKLGVRPVYYWVGERFTVFATAIRIIEACADVPKVMDLRAVTELASLGYPLGRRTPYLDVHVLHSGEIARVVGGTLERHRYWSWDRVIASQKDDITIREIHESFASAVRDRLGPHRTTTAFLSGGLDSRCVVSMLRTIGADVQTVTFRRSIATHDAVLSGKIAAALNTHHVVAPLDPTAIDFIDMMGRMLASADASRELATPIKEVWAGDGGSVGVGFVYLNEQIVRLLRRGDTQEALEIYLSRHSAGVGGPSRWKGCSRNSPSFPTSSRLAASTCFS